MSVFKSVFFLEIPISLLEPHPFPSGHKYLRESVRRDAFQC